MNASPVDSPTRPASPANLALVSTELRTGGAEKCLVELATRVDPARFSPHVVCLAPPPDPPRDGLWRRLQEAGVATEFLNCTRSWQFLRAVRQLAALWAERPPAVVQSFLFHANVVAYWAARRSRRPPLCWGMRVADPSRKRQFLERRLAPSVDRLVCVSDSVAAFYRDSVGIPADKLAVIANSVDVGPVAAAEPAQLELWGKCRRRIVCAGRLESQKGFDGLLDNVDTLLRDPDSCLLILGEGSQRDQLQQQARAAAAADRIHFLGWRSDFHSILRACHLLLLPSRWEGMPNVVLEAMAAGLPVAAFAVEGTREALGPLSDAQTAEPGDLGALIATAHRLLDGDSAIGDANRHRALEQFTPAEMVARYERLWTETAAADRHP